MRCQVCVELIVGLVGSVKAGEDLGDTFHLVSLPESGWAHQVLYGREPWARQPQCARRLRSRLVLDGASLSRRNDLIRVHSAALRRLDCVRYAVFLVAERCVQFRQEFKRPPRRRALVAGLVEQIEARAAAVRAATGAPVLGPTAIQDQHPHDRPKRSKKSPAPFFHAFTKSVRKLFQEAYSRFLVAFREAAESLKAGDLTAPFPVGCFPPGLPFVTASP